MDSIDQVRNGTLIKIKIEMAHEELQRKLERLGARQSLIYPGLESVAKDIMSEELRA